MSPPSIALGLASALVGCAVGVALTKWDLLHFNYEVPIADFASLLFSIAAFLLVPFAIAHFERRNAFDRRAIAECIEPALESLIEIEEVLGNLVSDASDPVVRDALIKHFRRLRGNVERALRIAKTWGREQSFVDELETAAGLARNLNRLATGPTPYTKLSHALEIADGLHKQLLLLLRGLA